SGHGGPAGRDRGDPRRLRGGPAADRRGAGGHRGAGCPAAGDERRAQRPPVAARPRRSVPDGLGGAGVGAAGAAVRHRSHGCGRQDRDALMTATDELLEARERLLGPSLSLSYRTPLHIVRGEGAYLYDANGRAYLDCVNNVAHVGHAHPRVVEAGAAQMRQLNTNTRYLHELVLRYADRLTALLPDHLEVCYFVNSGSEANELALRLARTATGRRDVATVDGAYHGNTQRLVEVSPYKFGGPGGEGPPDDVQVVPLADPYRGGHRGDGPEVGAAYLGEARAVLDGEAGRGHAAGAVIAEAIPSVAGQVVPPGGWLAGLFDAARSIGAVPIADEVQVGFGRVGVDTWA